MWMRHRHVGGERCIEGEEMWGGSGGGVARPSPHTQPRGGRKMDVAVFVPPAPSPLDPASRLSNGHSNMADARRRKMNSFARRHQYKVFSDAAVFRRMVWGTTHTLPHCHRDGESSAPANIDPLLGAQDPLDLGKSPLLIGAPAWASNLSDAACGGSHNTHAATSILPSHHLQDSLAPL